MIGLDIHVPFASWVKPNARQFRETEIMAPPSTCYGFLLSLVGEEDVRKHVGVRICPALIPNKFGKLPQKQTQLRLLRRFKDTKDISNPQNSIPEYQDVYANVRMAVWIDSSNEIHRNQQSLEDRVNIALDHPEQITRFGPLSLGESLWLVNSIDRLQWDRLPNGTRAFLAHPQGRFSLSTWIDYRNNYQTTYAHGNLEFLNSNPEFHRMSMISA